MSQAMGAAQAKTVRQEAELLVLIELHLCEVQVTQTILEAKKKSIKHEFWPHAPLLLTVGESFYLPQLQFVSCMK